MYANYHTHTVRCHHARGSEREYVETAISRGVRVLGFSDHVPYPFPNGFESDFRVPLAQLEDYVTAVLDLKREYADQIELHLGFEAEYYPAYHRILLEYLEPYPYEYLIMGQHFVGNEIDAPVYAAGLKGSESLNRYVDQVLEGLATGDFMYLAHPDLPSREHEQAYYTEAMARLCKGTKALGIPLELNFLGLADGRAYPCRAFWEIVSRTGNDIIFGCDAHDPDAVANPGILALALEWQKQYGLHVIDRIPLFRPMPKKQKND